MTALRIVAISNDEFWLKAVIAATEGALVAEVLCIGENLAQCQPGAWEPSRADLVLVDASRRQDLVDAVRTIRRQGWRYVVVVAADPSWKEALAVLRDAGGYDYWRKTYDVEAIRAHVRGCVKEMEEATTRETGRSVGQQENRTKSGART